MSNSNTASGGIGLGDAIFLVFLVLKLTGTDPVASWSWWWVTSPLWIPIGIVLGLFAIGFIVMAFLGGIGMISDGIRRRGRVARMMKDLGD